MLQSRFLAVPAALVLSLGALALSEDPKPKPAPQPEAPKVAEVGKPAPDFTLTGIDGKEVKLSDYKDKIVVLEWFNPGCPVVVRHHDKDSLKGTAGELTQSGVVWLAINSGAPGQQGHGEEANRKAAEKWGLKHPILVDEAGTVGRSYGAKTTPHMFVIDAKGVLAYAGAIDNDPSGEMKPEERINYVRAAVASLQKNEPVKTTTSKAYGCSVKYGKPPAQ
jgi:peroxiredoxin